ncbi:hypothetical protein EMIHUDRAFT_468537 [Emiliania huxleyi CCMP1516]|uniref:SANT domain-containing protein n=2 Tax=Emiliania huxleyi TaxID=2903 RepID=A0A0D3K1E4_EMIH1|nr:hypothetical protein EMIHUDRAFT_468537 [Emiliania huxleyi CCMP1516]EOD29579.1 hypothetical protein EMIHUDRAFT_468537 [Emiliania huxleyi CCMP1516]|eukprot:XP_005782008.1 hypothetical protein EMIHUDRAFT_468537 [Emiliania huxleyi CCMP1516]
MIEGSVEEKIIERAQRKLYLDAAVIQQGRLADQSKSLSKDEMLSMIRFGADAVFHTKGGGEPTDEDIEALLLRGEERTRADESKLKDQANSLANFTLDGQERSMYELDGQDWSKGSEAATQWSLSLPKRITKQNYDETAHQQRAGLRMPKQVQIHDFQFFDARRLHALRDQEVAHWQWKQDRVLARRAREEDEEGEDELTRKASAAGVPPLSDAELDEREALLRDGFSSWSRKDFNAFVKACERHGRDDVASISLELGDRRPVGEGGEAKIQRRIEIASALAKKVSATANPWVGLRLRYDDARGAHFTEENDRFLACMTDQIIVCMTNQIGYDRWEELREEVRASWLFRFDWWFRTRTAQELQQRVDYLSQLIEAEIDEIEAADDADGRKRKGGAAKGPPVKKARR